MTALAAGFTLDASRVGELWLLQCDLSGKRVHLSSRIRTDAVCCDGAITSLGNPALDGIYAGRDGTCSEVPHMR